MNYIVVDLEWNQPMSFDSHVYREVGDRLIFEMIQIGAVKVGENFEVVDSISIPIRPTHYVKIHPRIRKMTQLGAEELADAPQFLEAMDQFAAWCGEDYTLLFGFKDRKIEEINLEDKEKLKHLMFSNAVSSEYKSRMLPEILRFYQVHAYDAMIEEYDPLENYNRHEKADDDFSPGASYEQQLSADNATTYQADRKSISSGKDQRDFESHIHGNIGVTTVAQMMEGELETYPKINIINYIVQAFKERFCLLVY